MRKLAIGFALMVALTLFAAPMFAQEYGCYDCRTEATPDATFSWCDHPADNSWGWDQPCEWFVRNDLVICRRIGMRCYYFEVYG